MSVKNVTAFCHCQKSLPEAKVKRFRLLALTKEISKKPNRDFVLWFSLMKSSLMKSGKLRKRKYKIYGSCNKGATGSRMEMNPVF